MATLQSGAKCLGNLEALAVADNVTGSVPLAVSSGVRVFHPGAPDGCAEPFEAPGSAGSASCRAPSRAGARAEAAASLLPSQNPPCLQPTLPQGWGMHSPSWSSSSGESGHGSRTVPSLCSFPPQQGHAPPASLVSRERPGSGSTRGTPCPVPESATGSGQCKHPERVCIGLGPTHSRRRRSVQWPVRISSLGRVSRVSPPQQGATGQAPGFPGTGSWNLAG